LQNFNLITLKESSYIEGLTRITILLAKLTILFVPITFVASYFNLNLRPSSADPNSPEPGPIVYTVQQFWVASAVIFAGSVLGLVLFGQLSGTQEGKPIYESFSRVTYRTWRRIFQRRMDRGRMRKEGLGHNHS